MEELSITVGFIGIDELSLELVTSLLRSGHSVKAYEKSGQLMDKFLELGGIRCGCHEEARNGVSALIISVDCSEQINDILFCHGSSEGLCSRTIIILCSTMSPKYSHKLKKKLTVIDKYYSLVDMYVFRGISDGKIMIAASGTSPAIERARPLLSDMCEKLFVFEGDFDQLSKVKMVNELLVAIHFVASAEALCLGVQAGFHPWMLHDIISNAAGSSSIFKNLVPDVLKGNLTKNNFIHIIVHNLKIVFDTAKLYGSLLPLLTAAHQQLIFGSSFYRRDVKDVTLLKVWELQYGVAISEAATEKSYDPELLANDIVEKSDSVGRIGFLGLGAMGFGMATHLMKSKYTVLGYDVYDPSMSRFESAGGIIGRLPSDICRDVDVVIVMVANEKQVDSVLFGDQGAVKALPSGAAVIVSSTVSPVFIRNLDNRLRCEQRDLKLVDAPVSGGVKRAALGTLTITASGTQAALKRTSSVLSALSEKLYVIKGSCGNGSAMKMVNQLLAGVHIASAAEAMAFGAKMHLNARTLFEVIKNLGGTSWMFENRVPHMLDNDYTPHSAVSIFVKDMGIVSDECASRSIPIHVAAVTGQLFLTALFEELGSLDDSAVIKVYGIGDIMKEQEPVLDKKSVFQSLPPEWPQDPINDTSCVDIHSWKTLIVLDDDPTGTQTVHNVDVLMEWSVASLVEQLKRKPKCFFILTNSRSLNSEKASQLIKDICRNIHSAAELVEKTKCTVVLRGDSTLRGHFPEEPEAVVSILGEVDAWIICPFFLQGGRYTINDIHYVETSDSLVPAADTEFARDVSFGYKHSNLRRWVEEKTLGRISEASVRSISIELLRKGGPDAVSKYLCSLPKGSVCIVNSASERDMAVFSSGIIQAELKGKSFLCRTAASYVSSRIGIKPKAPIYPKDLSINCRRNGGLIVVGSYVPKTTQQIEKLKILCGSTVCCIEISVDKLAFGSEEERKREIESSVQMVDSFLQDEKDTLIMTSRIIVTGETPSDSLEINFKVSSALVEIVRGIKTRPRYIIAKGGITSSDIATKGLEAKSARVVGQAIPGVPLWQLGPESRYPGVPYIVFPGNVGDAKGLADVVMSWSHRRGSPTEKILINAERGKYAVGAFNIYNLEGVQAVVMAAEEEKSPAILQIHPSALKQGGVPLVACCISARNEASVPIAVHFDHGTSEDELLRVLNLGFDSMMVDGSHLSFEENISYTKRVTGRARSKGLLVEAELGRLSGTEDGSRIEDYEAKLTDIAQARKFIHDTDIDALAVCIGNVHGKYPAGGPHLRLDLLKDLNVLATEKGVFLVLHGASGLPAQLIRECIGKGVTKFNVNTEIREAYMDAVRRPPAELVGVMGSAVEAMKGVVAEKMRLFGSSGKALSLYF